MVNPRQLQYISGKFKVQKPTDIRIVGHVVIRQERRRKVCRAENRQLTGKTKNEK